MKRNPYLGIILVLGVSCLYLGWRWRGALEAVTASRNQAQATEAAQQKERQRTDMELAVARYELEQARTELAVQQQAAEAASTQPVVRLFDADLDELRQQGFKDPVVDLVADLQTRTDLIPMAGVLGGTQAWRPSERWVVGKSFVVAEFDDGHVGGTMLLRYVVANGRITWAPLHWEQF